MVGARINIIIDWMAKRERAHARERERARARESTVQDYHMQISCMVTESQSAHLKPVLAT